MASHVFYKFKSQKEPTKVTFEGTGITVWDLKKIVIHNEKMGSGKDFDLALYHHDTGDEYKDDHTLIPRASLVVARRLPAVRSGFGTAQRYTAHAHDAKTAHSDGSWQRSAGGNMSKRFDQVSEKPKSPTAINGGSGGADEASRIAAMFASSSEVWEQTQDQMKGHQKVAWVPRGGAGGGRGGPPRQNFIVPDKPPPQGYICFRCGQKGHWIQECPTNEMPEFNSRPRILRSTGIPRSFLTTVEGPDQNVEGRAGVMVTADGGFVVARADHDSWNRHRQITKATGAIDLDALQPADPELLCPIDGRLLRDAVSTPCCSSVFCEECIQSHLTDNDFVCPECESKVRSLSMLIPAQDRRDRVDSFVKTMTEEKERREQEAKEAGEIEDADSSSADKAIGSPKPAGEQPSTTSAATPVAPVEAAVASPTPVAASSSTPAEPSQPSAPTAEASEPVSDPKTVDSPSKTDNAPPSQPKAKSPTPPSQPLPSGPRAQRNAPAKAPTRPTQQQSHGNPQMGFGGPNFEGGSFMPMMGGMMNPQMMAMQLQVMVANPMVHPQMRAQAAQQLAMLGMGMGMMNGGGGFGSGGGRFPNGNGGGGGHMNGFGNGFRSGAGKRQRPSDFVELRAGGEKEARVE